MALTIQRVPRGLNDVLSIFGGQTPKGLAEEIAGIIDTLQFYGLAQQQFQANAANIAQDGTVVLTVPSNQYWVLFQAHVVMSITAAVTAARVSVGFSSSSLTAHCIGAAADVLTVGVVYDWRMPWLLPYPRVLLPGTVIRAQLERLAGAANLAVGLTAQVGVLG